MRIGKSRMRISGAPNAPPFTSHFQGKFSEIYSFCYYKTENEIKSNAIRPGLLPSFFHCHF